ncbi:MAG: YjbQ family protein [Cyanobacteria bacterium SZAS LIN-5]|nr:YjbQ family protein [Cyanobacteria bacterium SZAS LIN-5]
MPVKATIHTKKKKNILDITEQVEQLVGTAKSIKNGLVHIHTMHTTAAVTTADLDPGTDLDMLDAFDQIVPKLNYRHPHNPSHVPDHIMSSLIGPGVLVPFQNGSLMLGTWQRIILVELDGPRDREIAVSVLKTEL